jgi:hypothetical protein
MSITCGLDEALSWIVIVPDFAPWVCGEKVTRIAQSAPAAMLVPHVELMPNWPVSHRVKAAAYS